MSEEEKTTLPPENPITIGDYLTEVCESKNITLKQISQQTKISINVLNRLAKDELNQLPSKTYVNGFIKTIAKLLHLDEREMMSILDYTYEIVSPSPLNTQPQPEKPKNKPVSAKTSPTMNLEATELPKNLIYYIAGGVAVIFVIWAIVKLSNTEKVKPQTQSTIQTKEVNQAAEKSKAEPETSPEEISENSEKESVPSNKEKDQVSSKEKENKESKLKQQVEKKETEPQAKKEKQDNQIINDKTADKKEVEKLKEKINFRYVKGALFSFDNSLTPDEYDLFLPINYRNQMEPGKENLVVHAIDGSTWVTYKVDDEDVRKFVLKEGNFLTLKGDSIRIFFGNVFATKVFYNNKLIKTPSRTGVKTLIFPRKDQEKYPLPIFIYSDKTGEAIPSDLYIEETTPSI